MRLHTKYVTQSNVALLAAGLETREPYADLRLIEFVLSAPPFYQLRPPPSSRKFLLREAMRGILPEPIRRRRDKGQAYRLYFQGIARHQQELRQAIVRMPDLLSPYIDRAALLTTIGRVALGDQAYVPALSGTLALVLWAHRLPWVGGALPVAPSWRQAEV